jgi:hypothetical protein
MRWRPLGLLSRQGGRQVEGRMHPTIEAIQRARDVNPRMVGFNGEWTRQLIAMEREYVEQIARLKQELEGAMAHVKTRKGGA